MKISVIIPAYNEGKYIGKVLRSLNQQTVPPDEIIVVDNNSKDKTASIASKLGAKVVKEKKQGMIYARNRGFDSAKYQIIARCDADVIVPDNWVEKIAENFRDRDLDALSGPVIYYDSFLRHASDYPSRVYLKTLKLMSRGNSYLIGMNMVITKKMWAKVKDKVELDDTKVHEDIDLSICILNAGGQIGHDDTLVVKASSRRIVKKPGSFFLEYPVRMVKTFLVNKK